MPTRSDATARDLALCRSLLHQAFSIGFGPPGESVLSRLGTPDAVEALAEAAAEIDAARGSAIAGVIGLVAGSAGAASVGELTERHRSLFGHTARGPVPPYETEYGDGALFQKPQELSDISGFYRAFGLVLDPRAGERVDAVCCELEFLAFLARKEAHAIESGETDLLEQTRRGATLFLRDHFARFLPAFARRLEKADAGGFYGRLGAACRAFVESECAALGVTPGTPLLGLRPATEDAVPMACGPSGPCAPGSVCGPGGESG